MKLSQPEIFEVVNNLSMQYIINCNGIKLSSRGILRKSKNVRAFNFEHKGVLSPFSAIWILNPPTPKPYTYDNYNLLWMEFDPFSTS